MSKKKVDNYNLNLINALEKLPKIIEDKRHNLTIRLENNRARSNQSRFEHISRNFHELTVKDIESIPEGIRNCARLRKDKTRKDTYNYFFIRKRDKSHYIKVSINIVDYENRIAVVKTIFITGSIK